MRKSKDAVLDGVCGGLAEHFGIDPLWVRLAFALGGWVFAYVILMWIMDEPESENNSGKTKSKTRKTK